MPAIGERAPDFELLNHDHRLVRLSDFRGRKVAIFVFRQVHTASCNNQACGFRDAFARFVAANAVILGINTAQPDALREWKTRHKLPYDVLSDPQHHFMEAWGVWGMSVANLIKLPFAIRSYWVIDEDGVVIDGKVSVGPGESLARALAAIERRRAAG